MKNIITMTIIISSIFSCQLSQGFQRTDIENKTLVVWTAPANLEQRGGSALTIDDLNGHFDGIVFGEIAKGKWMAGSDYFRRTPEEQETYSAETASPETFVQMAIVYKDKQVTIYRDTKKYASYKIDEIQNFGPESVVLFGQRHLELSNEPCYNGRIDDARIYDKALTLNEIAELKANQLSELLPVAWWSFEEGNHSDRMGWFTQTYLSETARLTDNCLVLEGESARMIAAPGGLVNKMFNCIVDNSEVNGLVRAQRKLRDKLLRDPYRPVYHFVTPEGICSPFDPNGAVFWKGRYHLFYIYQDERGDCWGHASSTDLVHWRHHPTSLYPGPGDPDRGMYSGNCFINKKGEATMLYHGVDAGNCIATSTDEMLDVWNKLPNNPIIPNTPEDEDPRKPGSLPYASWDPHGWLEGDTYYAIFGGLRPAIFKANSLDKWEYVGDLLAHAVEGVSIHEDISCPDMFKLGDTYVLLGISHDLGCRYYLGQWKNEQFYPQHHEQMSWVDNDYFAPESMIDDKGRRIMWAWIFDGRQEDTIEASGWSGTLSLPRILWLGEDGTLRMRPAEELKILRYNGQKRTDLMIRADSELPLKKIQGNCLELLLEIIPSKAKQFGLKVCCSPDGQEQTVIYYDVEDKKLKIDTRKSSLGQGSKKIEAGPLKLGDNESLKLQVFIDKSVVEVFANDRQAVMRRIYPTNEKSLNIIFFSKGGSTMVRTLQAWKLMPANPF